MEPGSISRADKGKSPSKQRRTAQRSGEKKNSGAYENQRQGSGSGIFYFVDIAVNGSDEENVYGSCSCPQSRTGRTAPEFRASASKLCACTEFRTVPSKLVAPVFRVATAEFIRVASNNLPLQVVKLSEYGRVEFADRVAAPARAPGSGQSTKTAGYTAETAAATTAAETQGAGSSGQGAAETAAGETERASPSGQGTAEAGAAETKRSGAPAEGTEARPERGGAGAEFYGETRGQRYVPGARGSSSGLQRSTQQRDCREDIDWCDDPQSKRLAGGRAASKRVALRHAGN